MAKLKYLILGSPNNLEAHMENIQLIHVQNNIELLNYFLELIIIHKKLIFGHLAVLLLIYLKIKQFFSVNLKLIFKY